METAPTHKTALELEHQFQEIASSPQDEGTLEAIFVRPQEGERQSVNHVELSVETGIDGDRWATNHWQKRRDGRSDPRSQVSLMNARVLRLIAGDSQAMALAGDNLVLDLDMSQQNLPVGSRLQIGEVILEMSPTAHTGCVKFARRYGKQARQFVNSPLGKSLNLRGRYARILQGGTIRVGDLVRKA